MKCTDFVILKGNVVRMVKLSGGTDGGCSIFRIGLVNVAPPLDLRIGNGNAIRIPDPHSNLVAGVGGRIKVHRNAIERKILDT